MLKKIMLGGIALAATGYGIKKLYEIYAQNEIKANDFHFYDEEICQEEQNLEKKYFQKSAENFNTIQKNLLKITHFEKEVLEYEFKVLDFELDDENFKQRIKDFNEFLEKYQEDFILSTSRKENFEDFNEEEKRLFVRFNELNTLMVTLLESIHLGGVYSKFADERLKDYINYHLWKDL